MREFLMALTVATTLAGCSNESAPSKPDNTSTTESHASAPAAAAAPVVTPAPALPAPAAAPVEPPAPQSAWSYDVNKDEMRGSSRYIARLSSINEIQLEFPYNGGSDLQLMLRDDPEYGKDIMLIIGKGQLPCYAYDGCSFKVKFDDGPVRDISAAGAESGSSDVLFVGGPAGRKKMMQGLRTAKRMIIEVKVYDAGRQQFIFEPAGLKWERF